MHKIVSIWLIEKSFLGVLVRENFEMVAIFRMINDK